MANFTKTVAWTNGSPRFNPPAGVTPLHAGDTVTVQLTGAPGTASIDWVKIYRNQVVGGQDHKNTDDLVCQWSRTEGHVCDVYEITAQSATQVTITDMDHPQADEKYWFSAGGANTVFPPQLWEVDPELINHPDRGGG